MLTLDRARERGAASLEYAGFIAVAALVVGAIFLAIIGGSNPVGRAVTSAICSILTLGQGSCEVIGSAQSRVPPEPCVVNTEGRESSVKAGVAVFGGRGESWLLEELSDGTFRVTRGTSQSVGAEGGAGFSITGTWDDRTYGLEAGAPVDAAVSFTAGEVYNLASRAAAQELIAGHVTDVALDSSAGPAEVGIPLTDLQLTNPVRWVADELADWAGVSLPTPDEVYYEGGVSVDAKASVTYLDANTQAGAGVQAVLGVRQRSDGSTTTYYSGLVNAGVSGGNWVEGDDEDSVYAAASAAGQVDGVIAVERDKAGNVTSLAITIGAQGDAYLGDESPDAGSRWEQTTTLPISTAADRQVAANYLNAMNMGPVPGLPGYVANPLVGRNPDVIATVAASVDLGRAVGDRGYLARQTFAITDDEMALNFEAEWIAKVGGSVGSTQSTQATTHAEYFDGQSWQPWSGCAA